MRRLIGLVGLVLALLAAPTATPAGAGDPGGAGTPPGRTPPGAEGPFGVGLTTFTADDPARPGRTLTMDVWYPTEPGTTSGVPASLDLLVTDLPLPGVRRDADIAPGGRHPLVAFSHGSGGVRYQSWFLMQALAAHGYVVVAPDHAGNTSLDLLFGTADPFPVVAANRPRDISFAIDRVLARSGDPADHLFAAVDPARIAVAGHSFGGFTALAVAGGYAGWGPDERVDAVIPIAAASGLLSDAELGNVDVPTLLLSGTSDETVPLAAAAERPWALISGSPSWRVDLHRAGHSSFTNVCDLYDALVNAGLPPALLEFLADSASEGCAPTLMPIDRAHDLTIRYSLAFLRTAIGHDARWQHHLTPQWAARHGLPVTVFARPAGARRVA
ncbi:MAG TPA: dienelactone hydrolase family protein [Acidimicrobiales bacterium]